MSAAKHDDTPIFLAVKSEQRVFNGYGAQETCDMLFQALISPLMPTYLICQHPALWLRFKTAVLDYPVGRLRILQEEALPYVSGLRPFHMKRDAHYRFLKHVYSYRRKHVTVNQDMLSLIHELDLVDPTKTIADDGSAKGQ